MSLLNMVKQMGQTNLYGPRLGCPPPLKQQLKRCKELEAQRKVQEKENNGLLKELEQNTMVVVLENTSKKWEKYLEKVKSSELNVLSRELEQHPGTIAYLNPQLRATNRKLIGSMGR